MSRRFGIDPHRVAIGGISMGGFGAYDPALLHPGRFCAVGGHSPALWFEGGETGPWPFDDACDFARNGVVGLVRRIPVPSRASGSGTTTGAPIPFRVYDEGFVDALRGEGVRISDELQSRRIAKLQRERQSGDKPRPPPYALPITESEAKERCAKLAAEHPDRKTSRWLPVRDKDGEWSVVKIGLAPPLEETGTETRAEPPGRTPHRRRRLISPYATFTPL